MSRQVYILYNAPEDDWRDSASEFDRWKVIKHDFNYDKWHHRTIYSYDRNHLERWLEKRRENDELEYLPSNNVDYRAASLRGYSSGKYTSDVLPIDIDGLGPRDAARPAREVCDFFDNLEVSYQLYFSGAKGYHIEIPRGVLTYKKHRNLADIDEQFVELMMDRIGVDLGMVDTGIYGRNSTIRTCGCPRNDIHGNRKPRKIQIPHKKYLERWDRLEEASKRKFGADREKWADSSMNSVLRDWFQEACEKTQMDKPVRVKGKGCGGSGNASTQYEQASIQRLRNEVSSESHSRDLHGDERIQMRCPSPSCDDQDPSAVMWGNGSVWCSQCNSWFPPNCVAGWYGMQLEKRKNQAPSQNQQKDDKGPSLDEVRSELEDELEDALREDRDVVIKASVGVGKSWTVRELVDRMGLTMTYLGPTHDQLQQAANHVEGDHLEPYFEVEPRCQEEPMQEKFALLEGESKKERGLMAHEQHSRCVEIEYRQEELNRTRGEVCGTCPLNPEAEQHDSSREPCEFLELLDQVIDGEEISSLLNARVRNHAYMASAHLGHSTLEKVMEERDVLVVDEDCLDYLVPVHQFEVPELGILRSERVDKGTSIDLQRWRDGPPGRARNEYTKLSDIFDEILSGNWNELIAHVEGEDWDKVFQDKVFHDEIWDNVKVEKDEDGEEVYTIGFAELENYDEANRFLNVLRHGNVTAIERVVDNEGNPLLLVREQRKVDHISDDKPIVILDATADEYMRRAYENLFDRDFELKEFVPEEHKSQVIQKPNRSWARKRQAEYMDGPVDERVRELKDDIEEMDGRVGMISHKGSPVVRWLVDEGVIDGDFTGHYGAIRGLDHLDHLDHLLLLGDPSPNELAYEVERLRFGMPQYGTDVVHWRGKERVLQGNPLDYIQWRTGYSTDHYTVLYETKAPRRRNDNIGDWSELIFKRTILDEIYQAEGRARPLSNPCTIWVYATPDGNCPELPYEVDVSNKEQFRTSRIDEKMWDMILHTFKSAKEIAEECGRRKKTVRELITDEIQEARLEHAKKLDERGATKGEIAAKMGVSNRTIYRKLHD